MALLRVAVMSDIHLSRRGGRLVRALSRLGTPNILLLAGDVVNDGTAEQFALAREAFSALPGEVCVFAVSGNHDIPGNDSSAFRDFQSFLLERSRGRFDVEQDPSGAFYVRLGESVDLTGLDPLYSQKLFRFPEKGLQLAFLERKLEESGCANHIVLCHPPLAAHNPQGSRPYFPREQEERLQRLLDAHPRVLALSGHTHLLPEVEPEDAFGNLYVNDGAVCPTVSRSAPGESFPGCVMLFEAGEAGFSGFRAVPLWGGTD